MCVPDGLVSAELRGQSCDCRFNGSCFPLGEVLPIGNQSARVCAGARAWYSVVCG